jgi:hypothetical protein
MMTKQYSPTTAVPKPSNSGEIDALIDKMGDIAHESYLGCTGNFQAPDGFEYSYSNEVINLLADDRVKKLLESYGNSRELEGLKHVVTKYNYSGDEITGVKYEYDDGSEVDLDTRIKQLESQKEI